ncbi:rubrerythrin-like domain-containing protein [Halomarina oriensis]|uniref:Rubrerythrin-like domain-containing protein n=1 Tax=Halomarina oriensis TaxID=671145 RepID=A0A6B0GLJ7_9EURY|nr:rubrerythrin-like domain-containing protein [Halomarina oriensis]MWG35722.1 rubrerythrin-like domain-containing protein [Halomarina oriensis]
MSTVDPYTPGEAVFECVDCQHRTASSEHVGSCPECGGTIKNIAVARE